MTTDSQNQSKPDSLPKQFRQGKQAPFIILPVPYECTTSYLKGTAQGPAAIISALNQVELYDEELMQETHKAGIHLIPIPEVIAALPMKSPPEMFLPALTNYLKKWINQSQLVVSLGGEHSITYGIVSAFYKTYPKLSVLHLDAHSDLRDEYEGSKFSHATVMRRVSELCPITQVGVRSLGEEDDQIINKGHIKTFLAHKMLSAAKSAFGGTGDTQIAKKILATLDKQVYISIDLDVFDPAHLPAVGTPEPGGLNWYEVLDILRPVFKYRQVVGLDVVELCPMVGNIISDFTAAKLVYRLIGYGLTSRHKTTP